MIISYLPNWLSYQEWFRRVVRKQGFHLRRYGLGEAGQLLKRSGLYAVYGGHHSFTWDRAFGVAEGRRRGRLLSRVLRRLVPVHLFCATLCLVARKVTVM